MQNVSEVIQHLSWIMLNVNMILLYIELQNCYC